MAITNCFSELYSRVQADFVDRLPGCHKSRGEGLSLIASVVLNTRSVDSMENAAALPRDIGSVDHRYQYISRVSSNSRIDADEVMCACAGELFRRLHDAGETIVPALDQSRVNRGHEALMVSVRMRDRALPVARRVRRTKGAIGWRVQNGLLESIRPRLPEGPCVLLTGDRFCGTARLIGWCREAGRDCRLRMKGNITLQHRGGEPLTREIAGLIPEGIVNAELYGTGVFSAIGVLHEEGHREPWIIAMNAAPSEYRVPDYGMRRSIEAMFSDFKTRGFGITRSRIKKPDRLERSYRFRQSLCTGPFQPGQKKNTLSRNAAKKGGPEGPTIPVFPLQGRPAHHPAVSRGLCQNTQAPGGVDKLKGGKCIAQGYRMNSILWFALIFYL